MTETLFFTLVCKPLPPSNVVHTPRLTVSCLIAKEHSPDSKKAAAVLSRPHPGRAPAVTPSSKDLRPEVPVRVRSDRQSPGASEQESPREEGTHPARVCRGGGREVQVLPAPVQQGWSLVGEGNRSGSPEIHQAGAHGHPQPGQTRHGVRRMSYSPSPPLGF